MLAWRMASRAAHRKRRTGITPIPAQHYDAYQNPDGTYDSLADLTRDVRGIPCGVECTREAQARWSHYYVTHPHGKYRYTPGW